MTIASQTLTVHLLDDGSGRRVFYAEPAAVGGEREGVPELRHRGVRGWAESKVRHLRSSWEGSRGRAAGLSRRAWEWLQRRTHPDEPLLARFRSARAIEVRYPAGVSVEEAGAAWSAFLSAGRRRHWPRFVAHALVAPLSVALAPLPGPNLLGYWFAYRAVRHWLILVGLGRLRKGHVPTIFRTTAAAGAPGPPSLGEFLARQGVAPSAAGPGGSGRG